MSLICCFTGHRVISKQETKMLYELLPLTIKYYAEQGYTEFRSGGALGFDTIAALCVINAKKQFPSIKLCLYLPCKAQDYKWQNSDKETYKFILEHADEITYMSEKYESGVMHMRNRALVNGSNLCIAFQKNDRGGTAYTTEYASKKGLCVINMKEKIKQEI